MNLFIFKV